MTNYILQELPEGMKERENVVFPKMQTYTTFDTETVLKYMRNYAGNLSEGIMRCVLDALAETMKTCMPLGHNIKVDGLGVFSLSLGFDTSTPSEKTIATKSKDTNDKSAKTKYRHICIKGINFRPDRELIADLNRKATFYRVESKVITPKTSKFSKEERLAKALTIIEKHGFMTLTDYVCATGLCKSSASTDLKSIVADPESGITTRGSHSHKVWVKKTKQSEF
ncbi:MAG: hypothetical protein J6W52_11430 [Bacteroidaceae bacterium]|nr:hypothetical protein [Bacteroidaceae bacterium]